MPSTASRRRSSAATRRHLLEVAARAFAEHGFAGTSMSELVERSGLTRGAFYFHFDSKEELALATFQTKQREFIDRLVQRLADSAIGHRPLERFVAGLRVRAELMQSDPGFGCLRRLCTELRSDPRLAPEVAAFHAAPVALMTSVLEQAQGDGTIRGDISAERIARVIFAALVGIDEVGAASGTPENATNDLIALLSSGLLRRALPREEADVS
ncbi:MAG: TetR family transcriptional regulator [Candidatus Dormibacteraeota bacterium]|nr:TetR family transcriptional regulator [Candidatus Dormibacteraeota bacterium]